MKKSFLLRPGVSCGVLVLFFLLALGLESGGFARAAQEKSAKNPAPGSSRSYQQKPRSTPSSPQKNYQQPGPQSQPLFFPPASNPASGGTKTGFFSGFTGGVTGAVLGGMLFRSLGINVPGWGAEFGLVDIFLILFILGVLFYELKSLRARMITKAAATRAGRSPFSSTHPIRTAGGSRRDPYMDNRRPARPPGIR